MKDARGGKFLFYQLNDLQDEELEIKGKNQLNNCLKQKENKCVN